MGQRLYALGQLLKPRKKILITHPSAILRFLPSKKDFQNNILKLKVGEHFDLGKLKSRLVDLGYRGAHKVEHSLQFASRGDILDIYSVSSLDPIRVEFFDDEIESIRVFNLSTQESKEVLKEVEILPASDIFLPDEKLSSFVERIRAEKEKELSFFSEEQKKRLNNICEEVIDDYEKHNYKEQLYKYYGFGLNESNSVLSYFDSELIYIANKSSFEKSIDLLLFEAREFFHSLELEGKIIKGIRYYMDLTEALPLKKNVLYGTEFYSEKADFIFQVHQIANVTRNLNSILPTISSYINMNDKVVISLNESQQRRSIEELLNNEKISFEEVDEFNLPEGKVGITSKYLSEGFEIPSLKIAYISSNELFGKRRSSSRFTSRFKEATILKSFEELQPGDFVVHEYNGIGEFVDIKTIEIEGICRDFLQIAYAGNEYLYVPLEQFRLVRKYAGREGVKPKLSRLFKGDWNEKKEKIRKRINELADRLLALYGERAKGKGFAFPEDDELSIQFEKEFQYELSPDQEKSINEIKADMEKEEPMDRLLCGDVGFGKTEVAFRAAFKAISANKQVALMAPTTLLARQHYEVALSRFSSFGIRIALFSRLVPASVQKKNIELIKQGQIDFIIGTHRLLSKEIEFKDLGLLIVDEEQRFGVEQKEKIKELKKSIDVLTLSATPIPRTLQMSLVGVRDFSTINTPPSTRMPIQTYVIPFNQDVIDELIQRELARSGQVFYVYNRVETIYAIASKLAARIPNAQIGVAHGQMDKDEIEDVMEKFYNGDIDVLVCTSIIENGIDIPNANMIIVEDADRFGLSQLYQIKGRVGRGSRIGYAYLTYKEKKELNEDAKKRLTAIQEFTELGSGYKIAQRDLMIRGAGDMLGPEQAGFIDSIGLELYLKLLNEAVREKTKKEVIDEPKPTKMLNINAYFPQEYASKSDKLSLYQELDECKNQAELDKFEKKIRDIYGRVPQEVKLLFEKKKIDILLNFAEFNTIEDNQYSVDLFLSKEFSSINGIGSELFNELVPFLGIIKVSFVDRILRITVKKDENYIYSLEKIMECVHRTYEKNKENN